MFTKKYHIQLSLPNSFLWQGFINVEASKAEDEINGIELDRYPEDPDPHIYYRTKVQAPNGDVDQHSYSLDELYATKKEALEAAIKEQTAEVSEWRDDLGEAETTLGNLKQQLLEECLLEDAAK